MWQLFHIDQDIATGQKALDKEQTEQQSAARTGLVVDKQIDAKKKAQAGYHLERLKLDRQLKRKRTEADEKVGFQNCQLCLLTICMGCKLSSRDRSLLSSLVQVQEGKQHGRTD